MEWPDFNESISSCRQDYSFFTTSSFLVIAYHSIALVTMPLSVLAFYVIIRKTPPAMKKMKPVLVFTQFCATNLDLCCTLFTCPFAFFPSASGLTLGIFSKLGIGLKWQGFWGQSSIMMNGVAFVMLYENRQSQIATIRVKIESETVRRIYYLVLCIGAVLSILPFYLEETDQIALRKIILARIPCPTIEFFDPATYVLLKGGEAAPFYSLTLLSSYIVLQSLVFASHTIFHIMIVPNANLSKSTKKLQRKFLGCVTLQIIIPTLALLFPTIYSLYADKYSYYNQAYNNFALLGFSSHGFLATLVTVVIYKPYRDVVFARCLRDNRVTAQSSIVESTREVVSVQI